MSRVLLLFGGRSAEHEVSCASAVSIHDALIASGHRVIPVGIDRSGAWFLTDTSVRPFRAQGRVVSMSVPSGHLFVGGDEIGFDVAFPVLHGPQGEDGTVQGVFETCGVPYVGCGVLGSALAMDKDLTKQVVSATGIQTPRWRTIRRDAWENDAEQALEESVRSLRLPVFVKPSALGSSVGITRVVSEDGLKDAVTNAFRYDTKVVVEQAIEGREIEVAVLDGPRASVPGEVVLASGWYTYDAKYADETSRFEAPAELPAKESEKVRRLAERVFDLLGLDGLARIDFFYERDSREFWFNEANTMPGFTSISGFPKMWAASGVSYPDLCNGLVEAATERHTRRADLSVRQD